MCKNVKELKVTYLLKNPFCFFNRYDARGSTINATAWSDDAPRGFGPRARFDPKSVTLFIDNIHNHEDGLYRCRVDFKRSQTRNHLVNLTVIGKSETKLT